MAQLQRCHGALLQRVAASAAASMAAGSQRHLSDSCLAEAPSCTAYTVGSSTNVKWHEGAVPTTVKEQLLQQRGAVLWFTGLSGSGKSTVACSLEHALASEGKLTALLDGDNIRHGLNSNLGFTSEDRMENIRRIGEVSKLFAEAGMLTLVSFISPYRADRAKVRERVQAGRFIEIYMKVPLAVCETRDPKGLYRKARAGKLKGFTGIDDPYEEPEAPEIVVQAADEHGNLRRPEDQARQILDYLRSKGYLTGPSDCGSSTAAGPGAPGL